MSSQTELTPEEQEIVSKAYHEYVGSMSREEAQVIGESFDSPQEGRNAIWNSIANDLIERRGYCQDCKDAKHGNCLGTCRCICRGNVV